MKRFSSILIVTLLSGLSQAAIPQNFKNGVVRAGSALARILDETDPESPFSRCGRETFGASLFTESCKSLMDQLQKKLTLMTLESDIQIQSEKLSPTRNRTANQKRIDALLKLNLVSTQAEDSIKALRARLDEDRLHAHLHEVLPDLKKLKASYEAYLETVPHAKR